MPEYPVWVFSWYFLGVELCLHCTSLSLKCKYLKQENVVHLTPSVQLKKQGTSSSDETVDVLILL